METDKLVEKLLNEGLELLSSEKKQKQKKGFYSLRAARGLGSMAAVYYEGVCYKTELEYIKAMKRLLNVLTKLLILCLKLCMNLVYVILMELAPSKI